MKKILFFLKKNTVVLILLAILTLFVGSQVLQILTPQQTQSFPENKTAQADWNSITPGKTSFQDVQKQLGTPLKMIASDSGTTITYKSYYPAQQQQIILDKKNVVTFVKEYVDYRTSDVLSNYTAKYGDPDFSLYEPETGDVSKINVFLKAGIGVIARIDEGLVEQKWYFQPMTREEFMKSWGLDLSNNSHGRDSFKFSQ